MSLSEELFNTHCRSDRPLGNRSRAIPIVPISYGHGWLAVAKVFGVFAFGAFALGFVCMSMWVLL